MNADGEAGWTGGTWIRRLSFEALLELLASSVAEGGLDADDMLAVQHGLVGTNDELGPWFEYSWTGASGSLSASLALDDADSDIIHVRVQCADNIRHRVEVILEVCNAYYVTREVPSVGNSRFPR